MLSIFYNKNEGDEILQLFEEHSTIIATSEPNTQSVSVATDSEKTIAEIASLMDMAITRRDISGVLLSTLEEIQFVGLPILKGIYATSDLKTIIGLFHHWKNLGYFPTSSGLKEIFLYDSQLSSTPIFNVPSREPIERDFSSFLLNKKRSTFIFSAASGLGKTTLIKQLTKDHPNYFFTFKTISVASETWWKNLSTKETPKTSLYTAESILAEILNFLNKRSDKLILVFDDFQWADSISKTIIEKLQTNITYPHKIIIASREDEYPDHELPQSIQWQLKNFTEDDIRYILLEQNHPTKDISDKIEYIYRLASGHPLLTMELCSHLSSNTFDKEIPVDSSLLRLNETLIKYSSLSQIQINSDNFRAIRILAELDNNFSDIELNSIKKNILPQANIKDILSLSFIMKNKDHYKFSHDLFKMSIIKMSKLENKETVYKHLATCLRKRGKFWEASEIFSKNNQTIRSLACKYKAIDLAHSNQNNFFIIETSEELYNELTQIRLSQEKKAHLEWMLGNAHLSVGVLEQSASYYKNYLRSAQLNITKVNILLLPYFYLFPKSTLFSPTSKDPQQLNQLTRSGYTILEVTAFENSLMPLFANISLFHKISLVAPKSSRLRGLSFCYLSCSLFPLLGKKRTLKFFKLARTEAEQSNTDMIEIEFFELHYKMYSKEWYMLGEKMGQNYTACMNSRNYPFALKYGAYYVLSLIEIARYGEAEEFYQAMQVSLKDFIPKWASEWLFQVQYALFIEIYHPSKILFYRREEVAVDILAGANLYYASAEAYLGKLQNSRKHFQLVIDHFHQLQIFNPAFTICIKPFIETPLILFISGMLSEKLFKKFKKAAKTHAKAVTRSQAIYLAYDAIFKIIKGKRNKGLAHLKKAHSIAKQLHNKSAERLITLHLSYLEGDTFHFVPPPTVGEITRVKSIWAETQFSAHPEFLYIQSELASHTQ